MQLSLRPYVTAGVAIAGASAIAIAPIQPTPPDVHIPNPVAEVARDVQLTANGTLPSIETQYDALALLVTELGLSLTVPPTAAVINAIAPDLIPEGETAEAVATGLLLRLSGYAISGAGSIGTALQRVIVGFGCPSTGGLCEDLGTGYLALLVGAPSTIIDGFVNGGYGPDLEPLLFGRDTPLVIRAGGLINPGAPFILPGTFPTLQGLAERLFSSDLNDLGGLLGGLLDNLPGLGPLGSSDSAALTLPSIETQYDTLALLVTELGLSLTVPLTAAVINAIAPDLIPEESTAEAVATRLLLGLSGYAISGVGSIGTALQRVIAGFGCPSTGGLCEDLGTGYLALLVGAPSTIIDGFVNGGYGPDLEPLLFGTDTPLVIRAGGLINPGAPFILPGTFPTLQGLAERLFSSDLNDLGGLLGGLLDNLPGLGPLGSSDSAALTLPSIETQYDTLALLVTELGLSLTVPPTAAVINAIAPDLIPEESTAEAVATGLLLGLSGYAISGVGSIGTALQRVIAGFGCPSTGGLCEDLGTGYLALLVGAPSTIIDGFVNGGYGPDLEPLLFGTD